MEDKDGVRHLIKDEMVDAGEKEQILDLISDCLCITGTNAHFNDVHPAWRKTAEISTGRTSPKTIPIIYPLQ